MTEAEWLAGDALWPMLRYLIGTDAPRVQAVESFPDSHGSDRKLRLFACACYYRIAHVLPNAIARDAVGVAERFADKAASFTNSRQAAADVRYALDAIEGRWRAAQGAEWTALLPTHAALALAGVTLWEEPQKAAWYAPSNAHLMYPYIVNPGVGPHDRAYGEGRSAEERAQCRLLHEIFGNPFRPVAFDPAWRTSDVLLLAHGIYAERAFDRMPILADALQDAGCDSADILDHLRDATATHVRGCWALGLVLEKA